MPGSSPVRRNEFCPAGQWTQVLAGSLYFGVTDITAPGRLRWRRFSSGIPFYWEGEFVGFAEFVFPGYVYFSLELMPDADSTVGILTR